MLSVVIPAYNVERYLGECLDSLLAQEFTDLELVIVDDGSTDATAAIASGYADRQPNISVIRTENRGMGAARNLGIERCRGEYLGFADADDIVPPHAYELMMSTLQASGSDFAVGSLTRLVNGARTEPAWLKRPHAQRRLGITLDQWPPIMRNVYACTKIFRRTFWDEHKMRFPEGLRYEDQVGMTEAYLRARAFDIVRRPVYVWRVREDGSSVTQRRHELADLKDRLVTKSMTTDLVMALGSPAVQRQWLKVGLGGDLPLYFRQILQCDEEYWCLLSTGVRDLFAGRMPIEQTSLPAPQRLLCWLVANDRRAQAETVLRWVMSHPGPLPVRTEGATAVAELPFHDDEHSGMPRELFWLLGQTAAAEGEDAR